MSFGGPLLGSGGYFTPGGPRGPWMGCGCSSVILIIAGMLLVMSGFMRMLGF